MVILIIMLFIHQIIIKIIQKLIIKLMSINNFNVLLILSKIHILSIEPMLIKFNKNKLKNNSTYQLSIFIIINN